MIFFIITEVQLRAGLHAVGPRYVLATQSSVTPKRRPCRLQTADRADHADCADCAD